jgi:phosphatidylcholine synthase
MLKTVLQWRFLIHLWTLAGLSFSMIAAQRIVQGEFDSAFRWLLLVLVVDHSDGTLARAFQVRRHIPRVSGEILDLVTDVVGLTFVPMLFCWYTGVFLPGWGAVIAVLAAATCSFKYAMKERVLDEGYSLGAPPVFFSILLFWLLDLPPLWATLYALGLIALCWSPVRYPITSLITTHWKMGFASLTNYASVLAMIPAFLWLRDAPAVFYWMALIVVLFQLVVAPVLMRIGVVTPGFRRVY